LNPRSSRRNTCTGGAPREMKNKEKKLDPVPHVTRVVSTLTALYTNADCVMNKRSELENLITSNRYKPDIIGIVEVKAKSCKHRPLISELAIQGYDTNYTNIDGITGREVILYTAAWLKASPYTPGHACQESTWVKMKLQDKDSLIIGCIYRSPSSSSTNDEDICHQIKSVCSDKDATNVLILGDFNYPDINWECWSITSDYGSDKKIP